MPQGEAQRVNDALTGRFHVPPTQMTVLVHGTVADVTKRLMSHHRELANVSYVAGVTPPKASQDGSCGGKSSPLPPDQS